MCKIFIKSIGIISLFISAVMLFSTLAFASDSNAANSNDANRIEIKDVEGLLAINNDLNGDYKLIADLDLSAYNPWKPIGSFGEFNGTFDGDNHWIKGLNKFNGQSGISTPDENYGLFANIGENGSIVNVNVDGLIYITNEKAVGSIAGTCKGYLYDCDSTLTYHFNSKSSKSTMVGGVVGHKMGESSYIDKCSCKTMTTDTSSDKKFCFDGVNRKDFWYVGFIAGVVDGFKKEGYPDTIYAHAGYPYADKKEANTLDGIVRQINSGADYLEFDMYYCEDNKFHLGHDSAEKTDPTFNDVMLLLSGHSNIQDYDNPNVYDEYWHKINPKYAAKIVAAIDHKTKGYDDPTNQLYIEIMRLHYEHKIPLSKMSVMFYDYKRLMDGLTLGSNDVEYAPEKPALQAIQELESQGMLCTPTISDIDKEQFQNKSWWFIKKIRDLGLLDKGLPVVVSCDYNDLDDAHLEWEWLKSNGIGLNIWTVDDKDVMREQLKRGLYGIITSDASAGGLRYQRDAKYNIHRYEINGEELDWSPKSCYEFIDYVGYDKLPNEN